jgi:hypothetical protein
MASTTVKRAKGEGDVSLLERAADVARSIGGSVDTSNGAACPDCAPFGGHEGKTLDILPYRVCYNCNYETREADGRYIAK